MKSVRIIAFVIVLISLLSIAPTSAAGAEISAGDTKLSFTSPSDGNNIKGDFGFYSTSSRPGSIYAYHGRGEYYYSDSYFTAPSAVYSHQLAAMSFAACMTSFNLYGDSSDECYDNAEALLTEIGFDSFETNADTDYPPREDTIGVIMAKKKIIDEGRPYELVSIIIRGSGYGSEWAGNFLVGSTYERGGDHKGFLEARDRALLFIKDYISRNVDGYTKLWITGYSRGGAVSGLIGAWFVDNLRGVSELGAELSQDDIFTYTFEAAASVDKKNLEGKNYSNIFNIISDADIVPRLPFADSPENGWNFSRPGLDRYLEPVGAKDIDALNGMIKEINPYLCYDIHNFETIMASIGKTQSLFLDDFFTELASRIDRETYVSAVEPVLCEMIGNITANSSSRMKEMAAELISGVALDIGIKKDMGVYEIVKLLNALTVSDSSADSAIAALGRGLVSIGAIEEYNDRVRLCLSTLLDVFIKNDAEGKNLILHIVNIAVNNHEDVTSEGLKISENRIISAHKAEIIMGMLMLSDSNYSTEPEGFGDNTQPRRVIEAEIILDGVSYKNYYYRGDTVGVSVMMTSCRNITGWYIGGIKLSDTNEYRFKANGDVTLRLTSGIKHTGLTEWITEKEPDSDSEGISYRLCIDCGEYREQRILERLDEIADEEGDFPIMIVSLCSVMGILLISLTLTLILRKRLPAEASNNSDKETEDK